MNDDSGKDGRKEINRMLQRREIDNAMPSTGPGADARSVGLTTPTGEVAKAEGMIASFRAGQITKKAAITFLREFYDHQLDAARHHLSEAVRIRKAESTLAAEQFLQQINSQYTQFLTDIGLVNNRAAGEALIALGQQTHDLLVQVQKAELPDAIQKTTVDGIMSRYSRFAERLSTELGES
jgi:hypothetical protein